MAQKAPGKHYRKGVTLVALLRTYPTDGSLYRTTLCNE